MVGSSPTMTIYVNRPGKTAYPGPRAAEWREPMVREAPLRIESFSGDAARRYVPELARLRIEVFRDFPYLYAGSTAYEDKYLRTYTDARASVVGIAFADARVVGATRSAGRRVGNAGVGPGRAR